MASRISRFDEIYRTLLLSKFFTKGWGKPDDLKSIFELRRKLGKRSTAINSVDPNHTLHITKDVLKADHRRLEGYFNTPFADYLPQLLPEESVKAHFQMILPIKEENKGIVRPICSKFLEFMMKIF